MEGGLGKYAFVSVDVPLALLMGAGPGRTGPGPPQTGPSWTAEFRGGGRKG